MANFKGIVYLSEEQYLDMYNAKTLDEDTQYVTPDTQQGAVDAYTKGETDAKLEEKLTQDKSETNAVEVYGKNKNGELVMIPVGAYNYNSDFTEQSRLLMMNWADKLYFGTPAENSNEDLGATTYWVRRYAYGKTEVDDKIANAGASIPVRNFIEV